MGQRPPPSTVVTDYLVNQVVHLQSTNKLKAEMQSGGSKKNVVGGIIRSYWFRHEEGRDIAQGMMRVHFDRRRVKEIPVTVVILGDTMEDGKAGARIVEKTKKLSDFPYWVLEAHFSTYCEPIKQYVVAYDKFEARFNFDQLDAGRFFADKFQLTDVWTMKMRVLIQLLDHARSKLVTHGGLGNRNSYVLSSGTMKIIDVARNTDEYMEGKDITDLTELIIKDPFFDANGEWETLHYLLNSDLVKGFGAGWLDAVLGHPLLQLSPEGTIGAFRLLHKSVWELTQIEKIKLANLLHELFPTLRKDVLVRVGYRRKETPEARERRARHWTLRTVFGTEDTVIQKLFEFSTTGGDPAPYGGEVVHLEVINLARNMSHHAARYDSKLRNKRLMVLKIRDHLTSYLSWAYYFLHTLKEHEDPLGPYQRTAVTTPTNVTFGDLITPALQKMP